MLTVLDRVLTPELLQQVLETIAGAEFEDGKTTAGFRAQRVKANQQLKRDSEAAKVLNEVLTKALQSHPSFQGATWCKVMRPVLISRYEPGMQYGMHSDNPLMGGPRKVRTDLAMTLFLSEPDSYDGGELHFESPWGAQEVKLPPGSAVIYPATTLHRVNPVTRGQRLAAVTWIESHVRDPQQREILAELARIRIFLHNRTPDAVETGLAFKIQSNLLRMWADT